MKKIFLNAILLMAFFTTISCTPTQGQKIKLNFSFSDLKSDIGNNGKEMKGDYMLNTR